MTTRQIHLHMSNPDKENSNEEIPPNYESN